MAPILTQKLKSRVESHFGRNCHLLKALERMTHPFSDELIDRICNEWEERWSLEEAGPISLAFFLAEQRAHFSDRGPLVRRLVKYDIERHWSCWCDQIANMDLEAPAGPVLLALTEISRFDAYCSLIDDINDLINFQAEIAAHEFRCRQLYGDAISMLFYKEKYGLELEDFSQCQFRKVRIDFGRSRRASSSFPLRGFNRFGRQRSVDPSDCGVEELPSGNRVIVAGRSEDTVSREHFTVQLLTQTAAVICNHSEINTLRVLTRDELSFGQSILVFFPFAVRLPGRTICFY